LAAWRKMSRSVANSVFCDSSAATRARNAASSACGETGRGGPSFPAWLLGVAPFVFAVLPVGCQNWGLGR
jgi:hypothetical protein